MSRKGNCFDNACAESFLSTLKSELVHHHTFQTREETRTVIFEYTEVFYNRQRLHQRLGYAAPATTGGVLVSPLRRTTKPGLPQPDPNPRGSNLPGSPESFDSSTDYSDCMSGRK